MNAADILKKNLAASIDAKNRFLEKFDQIENFKNACEAVLSSYRNGGRIYVAGNGGSAADAQHLVAEFVSKLAHDRAPLAAEALTVDSSILTAIGNDYGYDHVFARQIQGKMSDKDIFLAITTSGNSTNIIKALEVCREKSIPSIVFTGKGGGLSLSKADYCVVADGDMTSTIQETHIVFAHSLCEYIEHALFWG